MNASTTPEPVPPPRPLTDPADWRTDEPTRVDMTERPDLHCLADEQEDDRGKDDLLVVAAHLDRIQAILALTPGQAQAVAATHYLATLEDCRRDAIAVRDVSIQRMHAVGRLGGVRIAAALGLTASRGQQLIYRAQTTHAEAAQHLGRLRRRLAGRVPPEL